MAHEPDLLLMRMVTFRGQLAVRGNALNLNLKGLVYGAFDL